MALLRSAAANAALDAGTRGKREVNPLEKLGATSTSCEARKRFTAEDDPSRECLNRLYRRTFDRRAAENAEKWRKRTGSIRYRGGLSGPR